MMMWNVLFPLHTKCTSLVPPLLSLTVVIVFKWQSQERVTANLTSGKKLNGKHIPRITETMLINVSSISIPFTYRPRTRSHRPIILNPCFFSSIKTSPEEWYQSVSCIKMRPISQLEPISCHVCRFLSMLSVPHFILSQLLIPASRIYGLAETIPFHVQLSGPISSLKAMYSLGLDRVMSMDSSNTASSSDVKGLTCTIRVFILRQVSVEVRGTKSWRNVNLGEAVLYASPPSPLNCYGPPDSREEHIDWEGELRIDKSVTIGGFTTTDVQVKVCIFLQSWFVFCL